MLALGDAWFADVYVDLTTIESVNEFYKESSVVDIHFQWEETFSLGK